MFERIDTTNATPLSISPFRHAAWPEARRLLEERLVGVGRRRREARVDERAEQGLPQPGEGARDHLLKLGFGAEQVDGLVNRGVMIAS